MKILIGCETSGVMRRAFTALGHDVTSVDLLPADDSSTEHMIGDVRNYLDKEWDMAIFHTPCTRLCNSGVRWLHEPSVRLPETYAPNERAAYTRMNRNERLEFLWYDLERSVNLFIACWQAPIPKVAMENPVMNPYARRLLPTTVPTPQIVQPWWFGVPAFKATGFYTRNLPLLQATNKLTPPKPNTQEHKEWSAIHRASPSPNRWKVRSRTFEGVADACAHQWGGVVPK